MLSTKNPPKGGFFYGGCAEKTLPDLYSGIRSLNAEA